MERGEQQIQVIPLQRLNTREENQRRQHLRQMFEKYDMDGDGYLNIVEMKHLIKEKKCPDMPKDLALHLLKLSDTNNDGMLDFDEFYKLSTEHPSFFCEMYLKYCKAVVPKRNVIEEGDVLALELVHCWWRVALVYLAGVVAGSMGTSLFTPRVFLAGASGGVYALITAHIATIIMNWKQMEYAIVQLFVFLVFCVTDLGVSIYNSINDPFDKVGYIAHASGALAGFLVGIGVLRNLKVESWERKLWWCAVSVYFLLMIIGVAYHFIDPSHFL
uniref:Rhomboid-like protein n=1 Tax=Anopheles epiroticus TaxID=199890 RepID=A0A182P611_9DIPT